MSSPLKETDREQILAEVIGVHNAISKLLSDLRRRYSAKSAVVKTCGSPKPLSFAKTLSPTKTKTGSFKRPVFLFSS